MVRSDTTADPEHKAGPVTRLPWIEEVNSGGGSLRRNAGWLVAVALLVIGGAYLLAVQTFNKPAAPTPAVTTPLEPQTAPTVSKPAAGAAASVHHKAIQQRPIQQRPVQRPAASVQVAQAKPASSAATTAAKTASAATASASAAAAKQQPAKASAQAAAKPEVAAAKVKSPGSHPGAVFPVVSGTVAAASAQLPRPGTASQLNGRLVQLGAFGSVDEAKRAWRAMERSYPPLKQFNASVIENRDWNGRAFYQFQVGTASQADSEMLCQSLQHLKFRCAVVVPPWKS